MRITQHQGLYQLSFLPSIFPVNCYLVEREHELVLVDAGMPFCGKGIIQTVQQLRKPISYIMLTHGHQDHMGAVDKVKQAYPNAKVCISERDNALIKGDMSSREGESTNPIKGSVMSGLKVEAENLLRDSDTVAGLQVISVPGHTPGSIALYDEASKSLICGDIFVSKGKFRLAGEGYALFPFPDNATWDADVSAKNAEKLLSLDLDMLGTGHGQMVENPLPAMRDAIKRMKDRTNATQ